VVVAGTGFEPATSGL